ncbi:hypothetical protein MKX01_020573 [Papaver californicum]|nr:hypothetical protein MKX01_020573 [Papaver californicum]
MRSSSIFNKFGIWKGGIQSLIFALGLFALVLSVATLSRFYSPSSLDNTESLCKSVDNTETQGGGIESSAANKTIKAVIRKIEEEMRNMKDAPTESSALRYTQVPVTQFEMSNLDRVVHPLAKSSEEARLGSVKIKPNRLGKKNFMGANGTFTSIGHACFSMKSDLQEYMDYDRAPKLYYKPYPINESLWKLPDDCNVRWSGYRCKNFTCLASSASKKGFFKCADCFNLTHHEMPRWIQPVALDPRLNTTADFLIPEVLKIKPGEIRIGLDFSAGTGSFAARMREFNVTIVTATINFGAPFSEMFLLLKHDLRNYLETFKILGYKKHKFVVVPKLDKDDDREVFFSAILEKPPRPF